MYAKCTHILMKIGLKTVNLVEKVMINEPL